MWTWIIVGAVLLLIVAWLIGLYNTLVRQRNAVEEAFSTMDVYLKQRWDAVPNFVEIVKGYAKHEAETLEKIIQIRSASYNSMSTNEKIEANKQLSQGLGKLLAVSEAYPDLKSNSNFQDLSNKLSGIEDSIAKARKYYNGSVKEFNNLIQVFPNNLVARLFGFTKFSMFEIAEQERENVKIKF